MAAKNDWDSVGDAARLTESLAAREASVNLVFSKRPFAYAETTSCTGGPARFATNVTP
ncbi:hypothetical protein D3C72_2007330 [compost metagenome]